MNADLTRLVYWRYLTCEGQVDELVMNISARAGLAIGLQVHGAIGYSRDTASSTSEEGDRGSKQLTFYNVSRDKNTLRQKVDRHGR